MKWRGPLGGGAASGKVGAMVASRAKNTQYIRARTTPVNPRTSPQQVVRNAVKALSTAWSSTLTATQRGEWENYGLNVTVTNALGDPSHLSGINWFVGNNTPRVQAGLPLIADGPSIFDRGNPDWSVIFPDATIETNGSHGTLSLASAITGMNGTNGSLLFYISRPIGPAVNFFDGPYQLAAVLPSVGAGSITAGNHTFNSPFTASGVASAESANYMAGVLRLDRGDGRLSSKFQLTVV